MKHESDWFDSQAEALLKARLEYEEVCSKYERAVDMSVVKKVIDWECRLRRSWAEYMLVALHVSKRSADDKQTQDARDREQD